MLDDSAKAAGSPLLVVDNLVKRFGGLVATDHLSINVAHGELRALIGPNGAGKTTLIAQLSGELAPTSGRISFDGEDITKLPTAARALKGLGRSFQITCLCRSFTALDNVALAVQARQGHSFRFLSQARRLRELRDPAYDALQQVGLGARANTPAGYLSHGEQRQLELAIALAMKPRLLLLDEPMAGLGGAASHEMTDTILALKDQYTILLVEHDMDAVFALADQISVLVYGKAIATGKPDEIRNDEAVRIAYLGDEAPV